MSDPKDSPADRSTAEIVQLILLGDRQAFRHLVTRYQGCVRAVVHAMLSNKSSVDDLVQQVFLKAFRKLESFDQSRSFEHWIKGIARNAVRDELRKSSRYQGRIDAYAKLVEVRLAERAGRDLFNEDTQQALEECISKLEEKAARAVRMHYVEERTTDEIGQILGQTGNAVRTMMHRARRALRDCLIRKGIAG